jgi:hypothetical protein
LPKLDKRKPFHEVLELGKPIQYSQLGSVFNSAGEVVREDPTYVVAKAAEALETMEAAQEEAPETSAVEARLGDFGGSTGTPEGMTDPIEDANRENAAALQAESQPEG